jgi:hypothetical protein
MKAGGKEALVSSSAYSSTLKMEAICSSITMVSVGLFPLVEKCLWSRILVWLVNYANICSPLILQNRYTIYREDF